MTQRMAAVLYIVITIVVAMTIASEVACSWTPHARDERTIANVKRADEFYAADAAFARDALLRAATMTARPEDGALLRRAAADVDARAASSHSFFEGWQFREEQKSNPE